MLHMITTRKKNDWPMSRSKNSRKCYDYGQPGHYTKFCKIIYTKKVESKEYSSANVASENNMRDVYNMMHDSFNFPYANAICDSVTRKK